MKIRKPIVGVLAASCALGVALPRRAFAVISDDQFNQLKDLVIQQGENAKKQDQRIDQLEKTHEQDQKVHEQDQQKIRDLEKQLGETQTLATNAVQKAEAAAQIQPVAAAPTGPAATHNFMMVGDAEVQFGKVDGSHSAFALADYAPIFLYRASDNVLFEAGFDVTLQNEGVPLQNGNTGNGDATTSVGLSFAQLDYMLNDYMTVVGGYMLLPLGTYTERGAGWLNKIPDDPMPRGVLSDAGAGLQLRGAFALGQSGSQLTYSVFGVNGPNSIDGTGNSTTLDSGGNTIPNLDLNGNIGVNSDGSFGNLHGSPSGGGRLGWFFPWKAHYDLELGVSGQTGTWDNADKRRWSAAVLDAAIHLSPYFETKGEYINTWAETDDAGTIHPRGWWVQSSYKLAGLNLDWSVINNLELVGRYDTVNDGLGTKTDRYTMGYVYYFSNTLLFEGDYEFLHGNGAHNALIFQLSYGF